MKLCLFGGTFDPPHIGHLLIADSVNEIEHFDTFLFVPSNITPHKRDRSMSSPENRLEMLKLSLVGTDFEISETEVSRDGISYTIKTVIEMKKKYNLKRGNTVFLMGSDSLVDFHTWKDYQSILDECKVFAAERPGIDIKSTQNDVLERVTICPTPKIDVSSEIIRDRVRNGFSIKYMVLDSVEKYIFDNGLYR